MALSRYRLQYLVKQKHVGAIWAQKLLQRPDRLLGLILLCNNFVNIVASTLVTLIAVRLYGESSIVFAPIILTIVVLIFSEVAPKTLATLKPESIAFIAARIYTPLLKICIPLIWLINLLANYLLRLFGVKAGKVNKNKLNKEEFKTIVSEADTLIPERYRNMFLGILDLESATVADIMTPRNEIVGIDLECSVKDIIKQLKNSPHTRLPVYKKNLEQVLGIIHLRSVLTNLFNPQFCKKQITKNLMQPYFIPGSMALHKQLQNFKAEKLRMGLVIDEYGDVQGLVSQEDLLQELVCEVTTEPMEVVKKEDGSYWVDGSITLRELNRIIRCSLPTEGPKTLNGLIIEQMEAIPEPNTKLELYGHTLRIISLEGNSIKQVKFYAP